jgi:RHS repeat-associated protein
LRRRKSISLSTILEKYRYDAFGAPTMYNGATQVDHSTYNNRFLFTGREYAATYAGTYTPAFTFYEYRARAYNPTLGRFMSEDPKGFAAGDYNLFRYCHNDPLDLTDPMGTDPTYQAAAPDHAWDMAKWADRSNNSQIKTDRLDAHALWIREQWLSIESSHHIRKTKKKSGQ